MSTSNLRRYFVDIQEKFSQSLKEADEQTVEQIKLDIELLRMMYDRVKSIREKKKRILILKESIKARNDIAAEFTEMVAQMSDQLKSVEEQSTKNLNLYSPYNNTKPLSSYELLNYAKKISHSLQAPRNYQPDSMIPANFFLPFPTEDNIFRSYLYFNSRTDGKAPQKCQTPIHKINNNIDIVNSDGKNYHMKRQARVIIEAIDPNDCVITYSMDGSVPTAFSESQVMNGEFIDVLDSCVLKVMSCKYGYLDSDILELRFIIDRVDELRDPNLKAGVNNAEYAERPEFALDTKNIETIEFLDTPYSMGRTPSHAFTPSYTPSYYREPSSREQGDH